MTFVEDTYNMIHIYIYVYIYTYIYAKIIYPVLGVAQAPLS